jgi:protein-S-isoprenylcysteine O-methyltransferase Ste14
VVSLDTSARRRLHFLDYFERLAVFGLFVHFIIVITPDYFDLVSTYNSRKIPLPEAAASEVGAALLLASEALAVGLVLIRRPGGTISTSPFDWFLAFAGSGAPLLARPSAPGAPVAVALAQALMLTGSILQIWAKLALYRSFGVAPANRGVRTGGPYRWIRHPMYAGYALTHFAFLFGYPSSYNAVLYTSVFLVNIGRLMREENILAADPAYRRYMHSVRSRLIPLIY